MEILRQFDDILKMIVKDETEKLATSSLIGENEFETLKKVFTIEGEKAGMRKVLQKLNEYASKNV